MDLRPYIGITDFTNHDQVKQMLSIFRRHKKAGSNRMLHVGVMMSYKTLNGLETKWLKAFPPNEAIANIFGLINDENLYYCLHFADYDGVTHFADLARGIGHAGSWINAVQLDMPWPDPGMIASAIHTTRKHPEVILQVGRRSLEERNNDPEEVVLALEDYEGIIHRVLLDKSMGRGQPMKAEELLPFARAIKQRFPDLGLVVAGGLGPDTVHLVEPLVKEFPDISIDAQGKLRPSGDAIDPIVWTMAETYLVKALQLLK